MISNFILLLVSLFLVIWLYKKHEHKQDDNYHELRQYLKTTSLSNVKKPILWIYIPMEINSRKISSFGDGHSIDLNQDYLYITLNSIIKNNEKSFHICIIDNNSFRKLIPGWEHDLSLLTSTEYNNMVLLGLTKTLYTYGGMLVPVSFLCFHNLEDVYEKGMKSGMFLFEKRDNGEQIKHLPDITFMGCKKESTEMFQFSKVIEYNMANYSQETEFFQTYGNWFHKLSKKKSNVSILNGKLIGVKTKENKPVTIEMLFSEKYIIFDKNITGIYIPREEITKNRNFEWFSRLNQQEVLEGNTFLQKVMIIAAAASYKSNPPPRKKWISFWKVPSNISLYGLKPAGLGGYVPQGWW